MSSARQAPGAGKHPPREDEPAPAPRDAPPCPFCGSVRTEVMSLFGSHASLTTCWCEACRSPFEFLRWRAEPRDAALSDEGGEHYGGTPGQRPPRR